MMCAIHETVCGTEQNCTKLNDIILNRWTVRNETERCSTVHS